MSQLFTVVAINGTKAVQINPNQDGMRVFKQLTFKNPIIHKIPVANLQEMFDRGRMSTIGRFTKNDLLQQF